MNRVLVCLAAVCLLTPALGLSASRDHSVIYDRVICIVPMIGSGTMQDPFRPLFAPEAQPPAPGPRGATNPRPLRPSRACRPTTGKPPSWCSSPAAMRHFRRCSKTTG
jgi:hypothetical protein